METPTVPSGEELSGDIKEEATSVEGGGEGHVISDAEVQNSVSFQQSSQPVSNFICCY